MASSSKKISPQFPTKCIYWMFDILKTNRMTLFCNLFIEWQSYF